MIMEATYGGSNDNYPSRREAESVLMNIIKATIERDGKVLMPVLGTGRAQEIMVIIDKMFRNGSLEKIPVYVQGIVWDITAIHTAYPDFFNSNVRKMVFHKDENPFLNENFKRVGSKQEMQDVLNSGPCVILATSGMLVGGASLEYFKELADNQKNSIIFTSYLGRGSLGRKINDGEREFNLDGKQISMKMEVAGIRGFTGHSTRERLMSFVRHLNPKPKKIILVHGDNANCLDLASNLHKMFRIETNAPKNLEAVRIR
jgi:predicted metal-dependent RNase